MKFNTAKLKARAERALAQKNRPHQYSLGKGGFDPSSPLGFKCDCSGFASWVLGISRYQEDKHKPWSKQIPWIETTAIYDDARGAQLLFKRIENPVVGCLVVYGDYRNILGIRKQGHVGVVTSIEDGVPMATDCASGRGDSAIRNRAASFWIGRKGIYCVLKEDFV